MSSNLVRTLMAALLVCMVGVGRVQASLEQWLDAGAGGEFAVPGVDARAATDRLFARLLAARPGEGLEREAAALGFDLTWIEQQQRRWLGLSETAGHRRGRGAYLVRAKGNVAAHGAPDRDAAQEAIPVLLQAPHRYKDLRTGVLVLVQTGPFAAAAWNTVPRDAPAADGGGADLARRPDTDFVAFSRAFARRYPAGRVVQIHGFGRSKRRTSAGSSAALIVSNGTRRPDARLAALFSCLRAGLGDGVLLYPWDVTELGGTRNPVGKALRAEGFGGFVHLELSAGLRKRLLVDAPARRAAADCIAGGDR